jgi:hypothetical protein
MDTTPASGSRYFTASISRIAPGLGLVISGMACSRNRVKLHEFIAMHQAYAELGSLRFN